MIMKKNDSNNENEDNNMKEACDVFKKNRIIYFKGEVNELKTSETVKSLIQYDLEKPNKDILMIIDSYGGYVDSFVAIHDTMKMIKSNVATLCLGKAMSAAFMLLITGQKGKRFITENSRIMVHELSTFCGGKYSELENDLKEAERMQKFLENLILKYTSVSKDKLKKLLMKDAYITAEKALEYGMVDHIVENYEDLFKKMSK